MQLRCLPCLSNLYLGKHGSASDPIFPQTCHKGDCTKTKKQNYNLLLYCCAFIVASELDLILLFLVGGGGEENGTVTVGWEVAAAR